MLSTALAYIALTLLVVASVGLLGASIWLMRDRHGPDWEGVFVTGIMAIFLFGMAYLIAKGLGL